MIPITRPFFDHRELEALQAPLADGWVSQGPRVAAFEERLTQYTGAAHALATTSCTTALHLALAALEIGPGDVVLLPSYTFVASANAIEYTGARPEFIDIDLLTYNLDPQALARRIKSWNREGGRLKALMPVHLFGLGADMEMIMPMAREAGLMVVEDAACALGALIPLDGSPRMAGTIGMAGALSFHPRKLITTGEGGALLTNDPLLAQRAEALRNHGAATSDLSRHLAGGALLSPYDMVGFNYRMPDLCAAVGLAQMDKLEVILESRTRLAARYNRLLSGLPWLISPHRPEGYRHTYQSYVCRLALPGEKEGELDRPIRDWLEGAGGETCDHRVPGMLEAQKNRRNRILAQMSELGIALRQGTHAVHLLGFYQRKYGLRPGHFPGSWVADALTLALPLYHGMTDAEQDRVIEALEELHVRNSGNNQS